MISILACLFVSAARQNRSGTWGVINLIRFEGILLDMTQISKLCNLTDSWEELVSGGQGLYWCSDNQIMCLHLLSTFFTLFLHMHVGITLMFASDTMN